MDRSYRDTLKSIHKILEIIDQIGEEQFRSCIKSYVDNGMSCTMPESHRKTPYARSAGPYAHSDAILSYQKSLSMKSQK